MPSDATVPKQVLIDSADLLGFNPYYLLLLLFSISFI
jgi:hypothetical protein